MRYELLFVVLMGFFGLLHSLVHYQLISVLPIFIILPLVITWVFPKPWPYLLGWSAVAEVWSTLPFGTMIAISFSAWLLKLIGVKIQPGLRISFLMLVLVLVAGQLMVPLLWEMLRHQAWQAMQPGDFIPWKIILISILASTSVVTLTSTILWNTLVPRSQT